MDESGYVYMVDSLAECGALFDELCACVCVWVWLILIRLHTHTQILIG